MIKIINITEESLNIFKNHPLWSTLCCDVRDILNNDSIVRPIYFVSPANSFLIMDGGIDLMYMAMFQNINKDIKKRLEDPNLPEDEIRGKYLPIGSAIITKELKDNNSNIIKDCFLISAPTMFLPGDVSDTENAYLAMKAILKLWPKEGTLILPLLCHGYGKMPVEKILFQINKALTE